MTALDDGSVVPPQTIAMGRGWDAMIPTCGCRSAVSDATKGKAMSTETMAITPDRIMQLGTAFWGSKTLLSAVELGVFTRLADGPLDGEILRQRLGLHPRSARVFFDALVALGLLERHDGQYANTSETALVLDRGKPSYVGGMLEMANSRLYRYWGNLTEGLRTGEPQNELKEGGLDLFSSLALDEGKLRGFMQAMTGLSLGPPARSPRRFPGIGTKPSPTWARPRAGCRSCWPTRTPTCVASALTSPPSSRSLRSTSAPTGCRTALHGRRQTSGATRFRPRTSSSWATCCTAGAWSAR